LGFRREARNQHCPQSPADYVDVLTVETTSPTGLFDPRYNEINIGLDGLNFGIANLGENGVVWNGLNFICASNIAAVRITGHLHLDANGIPSYILMEYNYLGADFHYKASYTFDENKVLPEFFPAQIIVSDYQIEKAKLSDRNLTLNDVDYTNLITKDSVHFISTNTGIVFVNHDSTGKEKLTPVLDPPISRPAH
jgi:hypothetical protein